MPRSRDEHPRSDLRPHEKILCSIEEAAALWSLSPRQMHDLIRDGFVPSVRAGRRVLIPVEGLRSAWQSLKGSA